MIDTVTERRALSQKRTARCSAANDFEQLQEQQIQTMHAAYCAHGGLMSGDALAERLRPAFAKPISVLAKLIVSRSVISLAWQGCTLIPMFQFRPCDLAVRSSFACVLDELRDSFDNWEIALWFATTNVWLDDRIPVDCLDENTHDVVEAARADRYIARG